MEISLYIAANLFVVAVVVIITRWTWSVLNWVWLKPKKLEKVLREQGLKGNSYRLLFGDLKESLSMSKEARSKPMNLSDDDIAPRVLSFLHHSINTYGKEFFMWNGPTPRVNIGNPEQLKEIFIKHVDFQMPHRNPIVKLLGSGLASYQGDKWAKHRKIINPAFHQEKLKFMVRAFDLSSSQMLNKWEKLANESGSCEIDVWPDFQNMTGDVISRTAFGSSYEEGRTIFQLQREQAELLIKDIRQFVYIPGLRFLPTKLNRRMKEIKNEVQTLLGDIINKKEKAMRAGEASNDDLLGILLESNSKAITEHGNKKDVGMSMSDVIEECKLFYVAGQETTSVLLNWTMVLLSRYPDWQARAREEVLQVFGNNKPDFDGIAHLKVVTMIINEVLRLYPPVVIVTRTVQKETQLGKLTLPAGVQLSLSTLLVHHDTQLWGDDANEFKPERFAEGVSKATKGQVSFFPFSWGPRICIGQNFAMMEAKVALSLILQRFTFELSPSYAHAPCTVITLQPQFGTHIILHKRLY
ncbi:hypothetical protein UlMin_028223 [Ulmus minor]